ncbi:MAG: TIGR01777 family oxidoreductase [Firmicutes bacterium]|nr:TIGR01777 family oxidoreductase [Bacillota bacterium]
MATGTVLILGGTGLIGRALTRALRADGREVVIATRDPGAARTTAKGDRVDRGLHYVGYAPGQVLVSGGGGGSGADGGGGGGAEAPWADAIINLAGVSLADGRWTPAQKTAIRESRIEATRAALGYASSAPTPPTVLINASAVGYYGSSETATFTEGSEPHAHDFLADVCRDWESAAEAGTGVVSRIVRARLGVVLARSGGALSRLVLPYRLFVGGPVGSGRQWVSWVHLDDVVNLFLFALRTPEVTGAFNVVAPEPVRMAALGAAMGRALGRPSYLPVPSVALRALMGEAAEMVLQGQRVVPQKALDLGYDFRFARLDDALRDLLR